MTEQKPPTQAQKEQARIKRSMKQDIDGVINTADLLSGKTSYPTKLNKKYKDPFAVIDDPKHLPNFLKFMETSYKGGKLVKVQLKRKKYNAGSN